MECNEALQKVLHSFEQYYTVKTDGIAEPFCALAEFHAHGEQYFLVRSAKVADIDSNEYVFFAQTQNLSQEQLLSLNDAAWQQGLEFIKPYFGHRNSDISLVVFSQNAEEDTKKSVKKINHYKSYKFGFYGFSAYNFVLFDFSSQQLFSNWRGKNLKNNLQKILFTGGTK